MKMRVKAAVAAIAVAMAAGPAAAQEVQLFHDKGFWSQQLEAVGDASEAETGVRIAETPYSTAEQYKAFVQSSIASGQTPGMFTWWTGSTFKELVATGKIAPLDDLWAEMIEDGRYQPAVQELFVVDGQTYAIPMLLARWVVLYDEQAFADAGIEPPQTWEEMTAAAEALKANGTTPFVATVQDGWRGFVWFQELMLRLHPEAYDGLNDGSVAYDGPEVRDVFETWAQMYADGWFTDPRSDEEAGDFARGDGAMLLTGEWAVGLVADAGFDTENLGVFIMPNGTGVENPAVIVEGSPIVVSVDAIEDEDVMTALRFWVSDAGANAWGEASGNYTGNDRAQAPNDIVAAVNEDIAETGAASYLRWWEAVPPDLQGELVAEMNSFMLDPTMENAERVMANMQALNADYWASR